MGTTMNKQAYQKLIDENVEWLLQQEKTLERDHIISIVKNSVTFYYEGLERQIEFFIANQYQARGIGLKAKHPHDNWYQHLERCYQEMREFDIDNPGWESN